MLSQLHRRMNRFWHDDRTLEQSDPEFIELFSRFAYREVIDEPGANDPELDDALRSMAILATLVACQGRDEYEVMLPVALRSGLTAIKVKEMLYQANAYLGLGRVLPFLKLTNTMLYELNLALPLPGQSTTDESTRRRQGARKRAEILGEEADHGDGPGDRAANDDPTRLPKHIQKWITDDFFGDYHTRSGLDTREREIIALCLLSGQGSDAPTLSRAVKANIRVGNSRHLLIAVISQCVPYIGYPRSVETLRCIMRETPDGSRCAGDEDR